MQQTSKGVGNILNSSKALLNVKDVGESTLRGQNCYHIVLFFRGTMFELQSCHYCERFWQFFAYYGRSNPK